MRQSPKIMTKSSSTTWIQENGCLFSGRFNKPRQKNWQSFLKKSEKFTKKH